MQMLAATATGTDGVTIVEVERRARRYRDEKAVYKSLSHIFIGATITLVAIVIGLMARMYITTSRMNEALSDANSQIKSMTTELEQTNAQLEQLNEDYNELKTMTEEFDSIIEELDAENAKVVAANKKLRKALNKLEAREELFDKYEYALYDKLGNRTDLTYDQVATGEELMEAKGMDPDLLFGIIMTESGGDETASNSTSTARGYGQLLKSTGVLCYEKLQGHSTGSYSHSMAYDGDTNISMMVSLLDYFRKQGYSLDKTINSYRGLVDTAYKRKINSYIAKSGNSLSAIAAKW